MAVGGAFPQSQQDAKAAFLGLGNGCCAMHYFPVTSLAKHGIVVTSLGCAATCSWLRKMRSAGEKEDPMDITNAVILGLIQGLAEFLPISSSGHLNLAQALPDVNVVNTEHQLLFNILLHVGTLLPVLVVFWKDWWRMLRHPIRNNTLLLLIIATVPAFAVKLLSMMVPAVKAILQPFETGTALLGACFLFTGLLLLLTQGIARRRERQDRRDRQTRKPHRKPGVWNAIVMGCMQAVGIPAGVSRSGSTIFGGVASGLSRETAARFSFMMSVPAILGALIVEGYGAVSERGFEAFLAGIQAELVPIAVGVGVAAISGYLAIRLMLKTITKASLVWFALYVILLGIAVIVMRSLNILTV